MQARFKSSSGGSTKSCFVPGGIQELHFLCDCTHFHGKVCLLVLSNNLAFQLRRENKTIWFLFSDGLPMTCHVTSVTKGLWSFAPLFPQKDPQICKTYPIRGYHTANLSSWFRILLPSSSEVKRGRRKPSNPGESCLPVSRLCVFKTQKLLTS